MLCKADNASLQDAHEKVLELTDEVMNLRRAIQEMEINHRLKQHESSQKLTCIQNEILRIANDAYSEDLPEISLVQEYERVKSLAPDGKDE